MSDDQPEAGSEMSFPASDPPSYSQPTIGDGDEDEDEDGPQDEDGPKDEDRPEDDEGLRTRSSD